MKAGMPVSVLVLLTLGHPAITWAELPARLLSLSAVVEELKTGLGYCEGPAADTEGNLYFSERSGKNRIWKVTPDGKASVFLTAKEPNGIDFDPEGNLLVAEQGQVSRITVEGKSEILVSRVDGKAPGEINDLSAASDGSFYFTNPKGDRVYYRSAAGEYQSFSGIDSPNGVYFVEERRWLYLTLDGSGKLLRYKVDHSGEISQPRTLVDNISTPDGLTVDVEGNIYIASNGKGLIRVFDSTGTDLGHISVPTKSVSNCTFGGADRRTLFITGGGGAYKVTMEIPGRKRPTQEAASTTYVSARPDRGQYGEGVLPQYISAPTRTLRFDAAGRHSEGRIRTRTY